MTLRGAFAMLLTAGLCLSACGGTGGTDALAPEVFGKWVTDESPQWADRYLELSANSIAFGRGEAGEARGLIQSVTRTPEADAVHYEIEYTDEEGLSSTFRFLASADGRQLRLASRPGFAWTKES